MEGDDITIEVGHAQMIVGNGVASYVGLIVEDDDMICMSVAQARELAITLLAVVEKLEPTGDH